MASQTREGETMNKMKVFNDPIHRSIKLPDYCVKIIDTPEFQRLRHINQLTAESVYPGATHNRFAHSIGVCSLAGKVILHLKTEQQPQLDISLMEIKCVELAGLCHDLGHGPMSHKFEGVVKRLMPKGKSWEHETGSVDMLRHLNTKNKIGLKEEEIDLISDIISGRPPKLDEQKKTERWKRYQTRRFIYQIVANKDTGVDVDKWDYFARDCHYLGISNNFDHLRVIPFMRVCKCWRDGQPTKEICFQKKLKLDLSAMFAVRWDLHTRAYQHRVVKLIEQMHSDALYEYLANDAKKVSPMFGRIESIVNDMAIYSTLDDRVFGDIARSKQTELKKARDILERIDKRELYQSIGEISDANNKEKWKTITHTLIKQKFSGDTELGECCSEENLVIIDHKFDYGKKDKNPLNFIFFYNKYEDNEGVKLRDNEMPPTVPAKIQLRDIRIYTKTKLTKEDLQIKKKLVEKKIKMCLSSMTPAKSTAGASHQTDQPRKRKDPGSSNEDTGMVAKTRRQLPMDSQ